MNISKVGTNDVYAFYPTFEQVLCHEFPGYTSKVIEYLLSIYTPSSFLYWIQKDLKTVLCVIIAGKVVGFAVIDQPYGGVSLCRWLGITKENQRQGIGKEIINKWEELARAEGCHKMEVASQPEAKGFYEKVGLTLEGKRSRSYFGIDQYIFGKVLSEPHDEVMTKY